MDLLFQGYLWFMHATIMLSAHSCGKLLAAPKQRPRQHHVNTMSFPKNLFLWVAHDLFGVSEVYVYLPHESYMVLFWPATKIPKWEPETHHMQWDMAQAEDL